MIINDLFNNKKQGMAEGSELKQAKRKYNQAAKDANLDQVGAGKKIDTMKKSLRQKDLGKEQGITEAHNAAAKEIHGNLFHDSIPPGAEKHHVSAVLKAHGLKDTDAKDVIDCVRKMGYTGSRLGKPETDEGRMVKGPGGVPLDRQGRPVPPKVKSLGMRKWLIIHDGSHGEGGKDIIEAPNAETAWELANEYDLNIISIDPYRGPARPTLVDEGNPAPGQNFTTSQGQQMNWNPTTKSWASTGPTVPSDGFDVVSNVADMRTTDTGNKHNQTYTSTTIQKNPTTGQQKSLSSWSHDDPVTGKNYSGTNYIDPEGNAQTQKNYQESKKTKVAEVSLGDYRKKAQLSQATSKIDRFFGRDDPAKVARADQTIAKRERGMARADARVKPYTAPPVDQDKQRRDLADKYPDIDELVRQAELRRDPNYEYADGQAYYNGRDAEHKYHKLKQIQRMIRGAELDEMDFGGVGQTTDSATGDVTTSFNQGPISVSQTKTPGGYTKQTDQQFNLGTATMGVKTAGPNIGAGQLAGTTTATATNNQTGQAKQQVRGVGFGGATGPNVGKNYVGATNDELAKHAADSFMGANETIDRMKHLAGIKPAG